jgi:hypothetical protein
MLMAMGEVMIVVMFFVPVGVFVLVGEIVASAFMLRALHNGFCPRLRVVFEGIGRTQCLSLPGASSAP